jgi:hypothetical protein
MDWGGIDYSSMTLEWDYQKITCKISMSGFVVNVLSKFQCYNKNHLQDTLSIYITPVYGAKM